MPETRSRWATKPQELGQRRDTWIHVKVIRSQQIQLLKIGLGKGVQNALNISFVVKFLPRCCVAPSCPWWPHWIHWSLARTRKLHEINQHRFKWIICMCRSWLNWTFKTGFYICASLKIIERHLQEDNMYIYILYIYICIYIIEIESRTKSNSSHSHMVWISWKKTNPAFRQNDPINFVRGLSGH